MFESTANRTLISEIKGNTQSKTQMLNFNWILRLQRAKLSTLIITPSKFLLSKLFHLNPLRILSSYTTHLYICRLISFTVLVSAALRRSATRRSTCYKATWFILRTCSLIPIQCEGSSIFVRATYQLKLKRTYAVIFIVSLFLV